MWFVLERRRMRRRQRAEADRKADAAEAADARESARLVAARKVKPRPAGLPLLTRKRPEPDD
jgi:hypothetical protein